MEINQKAISETNWALDKAYKIAVHQLGIQDWSRETEQTKRHCETIQIEIAKMIMSSHHWHLELSKS
jgi:hypothetical protein